MLQSNLTQFLLPNVPLRPSLPLFPSCTSTRNLIY